MCSLDSFCGPATVAKASALMANSSMRWNEDRPAFEIAVVNRSKNPIDLFQRMLLDEWRNFHLAGHDQFEGRRVEFRRTSPVAKSARVIRHEIGQSDLRLVHGEADHAQCGAVIEQAECRLLAGAGARTFKDDPFGLPQTVLFREIRNCCLELACGKLLRVESKGRALLRDRVELALLDINSDH